MAYYIGQAFGVLGTLCCLILPLFPKKWQMLLATALVNLFCMLNLCLIGQFSPIVIIYVVAILQVLVTLWHLQKETAITKGENIFFLILYVASGVLAYRSPIDLLPIVGAVFHMLATFQIDVQKTRRLLLLNASSFLIYYLLLGSTSALSTICTLITTLVALWRHRAAQR